MYRPRFACTVEKMRRTENAKNSRNERWEWRRKQNEKKKIRRKGEKKKRKKADNKKYKAENAENRTDEERQRRITDNTKNKTM